MTVYLPSMTRSSIQTTLKNFLNEIWNGSVEVFQGQDNDVPESVQDDFCQITVLNSQQLSTNRHIYQDCKFTGALAGNILTITDMQIGSIKLGSKLLGTGVLDNTFVMEQLTGNPGQAGTYTISQSQTLASQTISAGQLVVEFNAMTVIQVDIHGEASFDNANVFNSLFRDSFGVGWFRANSQAMVPLYNDPPQNITFINPENQKYEKRYVFNATFQTKSQISLSQAFADSITLTTYMLQDANDPVQSSLSVSGVNILSTVNSSFPYGYVGHIRYAEANAGPDFTFQENIRQQIMFDPDPTQTQDFLRGPFVNNLSWRNNRIFGRKYGDYLSVVVNLIVISDVTGGKLRLDIDVGSPNGPTGSTTNILSFDAGQPERVTFMINIQTLNFMLANGAALYLTSTVPLTVTSQAIVLCPLDAVP